MKTIASSILGAVAWSFASAAWAQAPALTAEEAAKIAADYLRENGHARRHYVSALALERSSLRGPAVHWVAKWAPSIEAGDRRETGLQIAMDGSVKRLVTKTAREKARDVNRPSAQDLR